MKFVCSLIAVKDIAESRRFYEEVLNQKVQYDFKENVSFEGGFAIHEKVHFAGLIGAGAEDILRKPQNFELYFEEDDLESFTAKLENYGVQYVHPVKEQPWGQRVVRFYDPDDHIVEVGESMESTVRRFLAAGLSAEDVASRTLMPLDFVRQCAPS